MRTSVIIPTHNKAEYLNLVLASLVSQTEAPDEIVIINDGSSDHTLDVIRNYIDRLPIRVRSQACGGRAAARNAGLEEATGDLIILCDDDRIAAPDFVEQHRAALQRDPSVICIGWKKRALTIWRNALPLIPTDYERLSVSAGFSFPYLPDDTWQALISPRQIMNDFDEFLKLWVMGDEIDNSPGEPSLCAELMPWIWGTTANMSFDRRYGKEAVFDETYKGWGVEDVDFCLNLIQQGRHISFENSAVNYHQIHKLGDAGLREAKAERMHQANINLNYFCEKHRTLEAHLYRRVQQGMKPHEAAAILLTARQDSSGILTEELRTIYALQTFSNEDCGDLKSISGNDLWALDRVQEYLWDDEQSQRQPVPATQSRSGRMQPARPRIAGLMQKLPTTHKWWTPMLWQAEEKQFCERMYALPLCFQATKSGMKIGYPRAVQITPDNRTFELPFLHDLTLRLAEDEAVSFGVQDYSDRTVDVVWEGKNQRMTMRAVQGCPSVHFWFEGPSHLDISFEHTTHFSACPDDQAIIATSKDVQYLICYKGCSWECKDNKTLGVRGVKHDSAVTVHVLPDLEGTLLKHFLLQGTRRPVDKGFEWEVDHSEKRVQMHFAMHNDDESQSGGFLQALLPHQWRRSSGLVALGHYASARGLMTLVDVTEFSVDMKKRSFLPYLPPIVDATAHTYQLIDDAHTASATTALWQRPLEGDSSDDGYWAGKALVRLADMANTARYVGHDSAVQHFIETIKYKLESYFEMRDQTGFYYDKQWTTLLFTPCSVHGVAEHMNDHIYYYGYFLRAAAAVGLHDRAWINRPEIKTVLLKIIGDVANPERDSTLFPFMRCFDAYSGHSWGNGSGAYSQGLNAEPSSESINFAASVALLGGLLEDQKIQDLGIMLYTAECETTLDYWFNRWDDSFPDNFAQPFVGMLWSSGASCRSWFDVRPTEALGVNLLPIQASSTYLYGNPHLQAVLNKIYADWDHNGPRWGNVMAMTQALTNTSAAQATIDRFSESELTEWSLHPGTVQLWIATLAKLGEPVESITCNLPFYAVFEKNGKRNYWAFNPGKEPVDAFFSDGFQLLIQPGIDATGWHPNLREPTSEKEQHKPGVFVPMAGLLKADH
ncbi:glycosyl hydrolase [Pseudomonas lijiangensis]|uniref:glycosyl hydrolase n=1 Tax=Pseudomonas lijiangensis TaxID=2995658 RepID=UPI0031BB0E4D